MVSFFDIEKLGELLKDFYEITKIRITVSDEKQEELASYPPFLPPYCSIIQGSQRGHMACLACDRHACEVSVKTRSTYTYQCHAGLTEAISPLYVGDVLIGLASSGVHSNGFSLVRKIVFKDNQLDLNKKYDTLPDTLGNVLLTPTRIYVKPVLEVLKNVDIHAICHITGGGFDENIPRALREGQGIFVDEHNWEMPAIFPFLEKYGKVNHREMFNVFNMGIGMVLMVDPKDADQTVKMFNELGEKAYVIGNVTDKEGVVDIKLRQ